MDLTISEIDRVKMIKEKIEKLGANHALLLLVRILDDQDRKINKLRLEKLEISYN